MTRTLSAPDLRAEWHIRGFRTGRGIETHYPPPLWHFRCRLAFRRGLRLGRKWAGDRLGRRPV